MDERAINNSQILWMRLIDNILGIMDEQVIDNSQDIIDGERIHNIQKIIDGKARAPIYNPQDIYWWGVHL